MRIRTAPAFSRSNRDLHTDWKYVLKCYLQLFINLCKDCAINIIELKDFLKHVHPST
jgi:hypothetical protein